MRATNTHRRLDPAYRFMETTVAWKCTYCARLFFPVDLTAAVAEVTVKQISTEFRNHFCIVPQVLHGTDTEPGDGKGTVINIDRLHPLGEEDPDRE